MKLLLVDGNSLIHRAYHATVKGGLKESSDGTPTNAVRLFMSFMDRSIQMFEASHMLVTFDHMSPTFRHKMYPEYKGTRGETDSELKAQFDVVKEYLAARGIAYVEIPGYEADDIIGTIAKKYDNGTNEVIILSSDKDLMQLVSPGITYARMLTGLQNIQYVTPNSFEDCSGFKLEHFIAAKALMGDTGDNIKGVHGIGPKTAKTLLEAHGSPIGIYANLDKTTPQNKEKLLSGVKDFEESLVLVTICLHVPNDISKEDMLLDGYEKEELLSFYNKYNLI